MGQALGAIDRLWKGYELIGKLTGELKPEGPAVAINVLQVPEIQLYLSVVRDVVGRERPDLLPVIGRALARAPDRETPVRAARWRSGTREVVTVEMSRGRTTKVTREQRPWGE